MSDEPWHDVTSRKVKEDGGLSMEDNPPKMTLAVQVKHGNKNHPESPGDLQCSQPSHHLARIQHNPTIWRIKTFLLVSDILSPFSPGNGNISQMLSITFQTKPTFRAEGRMVCRAARLPGRIDRDQKHLAVQTLEIKWDGVGTSGWLVGWLGGPAHICPH